MAAPTIIYNGVEIRNTTQQVLENKEQIARHWDVDRVLADFGITVLGRVNTKDLLPADEGENWGYGYLVGESEPYTVYVWTRPNPNVGQDTAYWLDIGSINIVGPQGPAGVSISNATINSSDQLVLTFNDGSVQTIPKSLKGNPGTPGRDGGTPKITATTETNGVRIQTFDANGNLVSSQLVRNGQNGQSIQGPQGIPGKSLNILGTFTSTAQFPTASTAEMGDACILQTSSGSELWILTGTPDEPSTYAWDETSFGGGTEITVNGAVQSTWNADTKLDKISTSGANPRVYGITTTGGQTTYQAVANAATGSTLAMRTGTGQINVPTTPTGNGHATSKSYVDGKAETLQNNINAIDDRVLNLENNAGGASGTYGSLPEVLTTWTGTGTFEFQCPDPVELYQIGVYVQWKAYDNSNWNSSFALLNTQTESHDYFDVPVYTGGEWLTQNYWLGIETLGSGDIKVAIENPMDYETSRQFRVVVMKLS